MTKAKKTHSVSADTSTIQSLDINDVAVDLQGFADIAHCGKTTVFRNVKNGTFPKPIKIGRKAVWMKSHIVKCLNDLAEKANPTG